MGLQDYYGEYDLQVGGHCFFAGPPRQAVCGVAGVEEVDQSQGKPLVGSVMLTTQGSFGDVDTCSIMTISSDRPRHSRLTKSISTRDL